MAAWVREFHAKEGTAAPSAEEYQQLLEDAGFVDINVITELIDYGCYTQSLINFSTCYLY